MVVVSTPPCMVNTKLVLTLHATIYFCTFYLINQIKYVEVHPITALKLPFEEIVQNKNSYYRKIIMFKNIRIKQK